MEINKEELDLDDLQYFIVYVMYNLISQTCSPYKVPHKTSFLELIFKKYGNKSHLTTEGFKKLIKKLKIGIQEDHNLNSVHQIMAMRNKAPHNNHGRYFESNKHNKHKEAHHFTIHDGHVHNHRQDPNDRHDEHKSTHANHYEKHGDHYDYYNHEKMRHSRHQNHEDQENDEKNDFEEPRRDNGHSHEEPQEKHSDNGGGHGQNKDRGNNDDHLEQDHHESHKDSEKDEDGEYDQDNKKSPQEPDVEEITEKKTNISDNSNQQSSDEHDHSDHDRKNKKRSIDEDIFATMEEETKHTRQKRSLSKNSKVSLLV